MLLAAHNQSKNSCALKTRSRRFRPNENPSASAPPNMVIQALQLLRTIRVLPSAQHLRINSLTVYEMKSSPPAISLKYP